MVCYSPLLFLGLIEYFVDLIIFLSVFEGRKTILTSFYLKGLQFSVDSLMYM